MKVSIIGGGGTLGSATAFYLGLKNICDEIILYDKNGALAKHHELDLAQALCMSSKTKV
jgi:malate/lactate dehydrogenase